MNSYCGCAAGDAALNTVRSTLCVHTTRSRQRIKRSFHPTQRTQRTPRKGRHRRNATNATNAVEFSWKEDTSVPIGWSLPFLRQLRSLRWMESPLNTVKLHLLEGGGYISFLIWKRAFRPCVQICSLQLSCSFFILFLCSFLCSSLLTCKLQSMLYFLLSWLTEYEAQQLS